jgi:N-acetylglucosaminylphosphatidylinositol deacetylase
VVRRDLRLTSDGTSLTRCPGDADGLGETRKKELIKSGMQLGLRDEDDVFVVDNP